MQKPRALLSVSDKTGIVEFARGLSELGYEILSTGGTARTLTAASVPCTEVSDVTGFPECLDGRVKTLHPAVHAGILAMRDKPEHMQQLSELGIVPIDVVAINLYPFKETILRPDVTLEEAIENIDIGGPTMLRAAAKNWQDVCVVVDPEDYGTILDALRAGTITRQQKFLLSQKVFEHTAHYDALIARYLAREAGVEYPPTLTVTFEKAQDLRYGENPHQKAAFYREVGRGFDGTVAGVRQLHGKELSYNNIGDLDGALSVIKEFPDTPCAVAVKHANPCGVGTGETLFDAYMRAYEADPVSIFGGIVALNRTVDVKTAEELSKIFLEIIVAPAFTRDALEILERKKNIRLLELPHINTPNGAWRDMKKVAGGLLVQDLDTKLLGGELKTVTRRAPTDEELQQLLFAWRVVKHVKSNAIVLAKDSCTVGVGPGQTNRITALELAIRYGGERVRGSVMASDAFFPFDDCVKAAHEAGITAIIQPGGSIRDEDSIRACDEYGIAMVFTGMRHFRH